MINNNKILTVSYGTFSCTLEGFDDSFGTMKAIAEYFRDLSADDRYFGSEPIQPDAQMLARIAEREISRHVEAREDQGRIVLSAQAGPKAAALVAETTLDDVADAVAQAAVVKAAEDAVEDVSAEEINETAEAEAETQEPAALDTPTEETDAPEPEAVTTEPQIDIVPSLPDDDVEAFFAEGTETKAAPVEEEEEPQDAPEQNRAKADSIADKLKRIRAVVSQQAEAAQTPDYSEDQHADATVAPTEEISDEISDARDDEAPSDTNDVLADTLRDLEDALDADDEIEEIAISEEDVDSEEDDIAAILNRLESEAEAAEVPATPLAEPDPEPLASTEAEADPTDDDMPADDSMDENILAAMDTVEAAVDLDDMDDENLFDEEQAEASATPQPAAPVHVAPAAPRTRVLKVKRATLEAAIEAGQLEEYDAESPESAPRKAPLVQSSTLTDEAEEDLARELAELEAEMKAEDEAAATRKKAQIAREVALKAEAARKAEAAKADALKKEALEKETLADFAYEDEDSGTEVEETSDEADEEQTAQAAHAEITSSADKDFSRLMEESNHQMQEPEAATRRDAFAHLRAAVAAKKADEEAGAALEDEDTDDAYRDDLANVVRPRRPVSGDSDRPRTERPAELAPAPLKLVAEQRIDVVTPRPAVTVHPRRVSAVPSVSTATPDHADAAAASSSFADFASEMGAAKLPDLLEAAAAYLSFVEGHEEFSRPQLMTKVRQVEKDNFTREDSLRSFGKLLREGKIEKLKGGRFQASDQIGFKPDARAAG